MKPNTALFALLLVAPGSALASAQAARDLRLENRSGQTFLHWRESSASGVRYRVYRSSARFTAPADLDQADLLGEVSDQSSRNVARSEATASEHGWVITPGGAELPETRGLFVYTVEESSALSFYAVTSVVNGVEDRTLVTGRNTNASELAESAAPPEPVLQTSDAQGELWGHWVSNRDTPFQPALSPWPSQGFDFRYEPGTSAGARGLAVVLHAAGQHYGQGWPHRFEVQNDVDLLELDDEHPYTSFSFWFGAHERMPDPPLATTRVWNYTQQRVLWTLDWITARLGAGHDPERVYAVGGSMGAIGSMLLAGEAPGRFAAVLCRNGLYDLQADDYRNQAVFRRLYGDFGLGLRTRQGMPILERMRAVHMASLDLAQDWPVVRTINGRNDETVGWSSAVGLMAGLLDAHRPAWHYFDERTHSPQGYWADLDRVLLSRTFHTRRDRPSVRFEHCSLDQDPGDGTRTDGDAIGTINGTVDYDPATATADADGAELEVFLRSGGTLDDAPVGSAWAALTPRRTAPFVITPGERVRFSLRTAGGTVVDEHVLQADAHGLVTSPRVPLELAHRTARFEHWSPAAGHLFVGTAPIPGDSLQALVNGTPGTPWSLALGVGNAEGAPFAERNHDYVVLNGVLDASGFVDLRLPMPPAMPAGSWLWGIAFADGRWWSLVGVPVQNWP